MPYTVPPDLDGLDLSEIAELVRQRELPPVEQWQPDKTGDSEMRIAADGRWYHRGGEITRPAMIRAFSSLLRREDNGSYWLVTPQYRLSIEVEDAPFIAVEMTSDGKGKQRQLAFRLNSDDIVMAGPDHPLEMRGKGEAALPYLQVRGRLWAKLARPVFYELAELALAEAPDAPALWSGGAQFSLVAAA